MSQHHTIKNKVPSLNNIPKAYLLQLSRNSTLKDQLSSKHSPHSSKDFLFSDRSSVTQKFQIRQRQRYKHESQKSMEKPQLHKKLLSDINVYQKQVSELKKQNIRLQLKHSQSDHNYNELRKTHLEMRKKYQQCKPFLKEVQSFEIHDQHFSDNLLDNNMDLQMIINKNIPISSVNGNDKLQQKIKMLQFENHQLQVEVKQLRMELSKYNTRSYELFKTRKNSMQANQQMIQTIQQQPSELFSPLPVRSSKKSSQSSREVQLLSKINQLQNYIKQIDKGHHKLKDRCQTIRNLIHREQCAN